MASVAVMGDSLGHRVMQAAHVIASGKQKSGRGHRAQRTEILEPLPEQRGLFGAKPVTVKTDKGQSAGRAYRREPYFETLAKLPLDKDQQDGARLITADQLRALRYYRARWESSQASETRCALAVDDIGGGIPGSRIPTIIWSSEAVALADRAMGACGETLRMVALQDQSFAAVAMARWGSRERNRLIVGSGKQAPRFVNEIVPRSSAHPGIVRTEFLYALESLTAALSGHRLD